ncbi:MAG: glycoside hydrolase family 9 protein [Treponema sp.]|nr:glycoside hydrolase family 9 protein [Treponema sp.]
MENIKIDQLGYRPSDPKKAIIPQEVTEFDVVSVSDNKVVFKANASESVFCEASKETVRIADFSAVTTLGEYRIETSNGSSFNFPINDKPYGSLRKSLLDFFHYQKCGVDLDAGVWSHPACHTSPAFVIDANGKKTGEKKDVSGGWHDAGDYGRYIVPAAQTVAQLLLAYELSPNPDNEVLDVTWFEIEWMLKMQDDSTGGVYHKVSCKGFNPLNEMPEKENGELLLCPVSATATADFAAAMAMASRFYPEKKDKLLDAAIRAWNWCVKNPDVPGFKNPPGIETGEYGDHDSSDERFWAACELFAVTGDDEYHNYIKTREISIGLGWSKMGTYGIIAYLLHAGNKADVNLTQKMKDTLFSAAEKIFEKCKTDHYGISLGTYYRWGSNMDVGNNAMTLLLVDHISNGHFPKNENYREAALEHVHYLLGKNALNQCYVSGFGSKPMRNPHHRPSVAVGKAVPGMVSGGPNGHTRGDVILHKTCEGLPPMKCFVDHIESCASNEIAIYWNSSVYFVLSYLGF